MNRYLPLGLVVLAFLYVSTTAFQCGSAETTSAKLYMQQKQYDKAEASLVKEVTKNERNAEAWFLLGQVRLEMKKYHEMNEAYSRAIAIDTTHKREVERNRLAVWAMMYNDGVGLYNKGRDTAAYYDQALDKFSTAIEMQPDSAATYYVRALGYYAKQDMKAAAADLAMSLKLNPKSEESARLLGQIHYNRSLERLQAKDETAANAEMAKAVEAFEAAYAANPGSADNITNLIDVYERTKASDKAMKLTRSAVEQDPKNKVFRYAYGVFLLKQEQYAQAIEQFEKAVEIDPNYTDAIYNLGVSHLNWGVSMKAEIDKKAEEERAKNKGKAKEVKEDPSYREQFKLALPFLEKAAMTRDDDAALWQQLGKLYLNLNMKDKAQEAFAKYDKLTKGK
jgi:tetratricopeptide (TPR) repeat protein